MNMSLSKPESPNTDFIPITSPKVALLAWEVFELTTNRHALQTILEKHREWDAHDALEANDQFDAWMAEITEKAAGYRESIANIGARRKMEVPSDFDDLERLALSLGPKDKLVCHVAMLKCYMALQIAVSVAKSSLAAPVDQMREALRQALAYEVQLYQVERDMAYLAVAEHRKRGLPVDDWFLVANPFGRNNDGPRWEINP